VGVGVTSARRGYNGTSPGVLEVFTPEEAPGMDDASQVLTYGVGGNFAFIDDLRNPTRGVHARVDAVQVDSRTGGDFDFLQVRAEGRGYIPVASKRRVIALRALVHSTDPIKDDAVIPFYRLPEAAGGETNFAAYRSHRFSDRYLAVAHIEYRWLLLEKLWVLGLAELGEVASSGNRMRIADVHESYGGGLRVSLREDTVARFQIATGTEGLRAALTLNGDF
jgi:outer membrane protein assembly factor BamA